ncbi:hypothetical protein AVEN_266133-1 [Araneus ventricosus]|uniref:Uncharacterized protein n=1 Tax=Araneus ventricosus TaxID=182803 RepID=A0A4Y2GAW6_ARAVE|nr:hypothetical protein AVEN_266133-1 [Araneus ventricosus]
MQAGERSYRCLQFFIFLLKNFDNRSIMLDYPLADGYGMDWLSGKVPELEGSRLETDSSEDPSCMGPAAPYIKRKGLNVFPLAWCRRLETGASSGDALVIQQRFKITQSQNTPHVA